MNLAETEIQLKKRWSTDYKWGRKQADIWDSQTNFIYTISNFDAVNKRIYDDFHTHSAYKDLRDYALNRWYNFISAQAVEHIFNIHPLVRKVSNDKDHEKDFFINGLPFDHKTSVFPKGFSGDLQAAQSNPRELVKWFYTNQSKQGRFHLKNRLFLVLHKKDGEHWRLKAELEWIKLLVHEYLDNYKESELIQLSHSKGVLKTDVIFGVRQ